MITPTPTTPDRISPAELRAAFQAINERLDQIETNIATLREGLTTAANNPAIVHTAGETITFDASLLIVGVDDNGGMTYKVKGAQYQKFGVRVWPETLPLLGIDPERVHPGPNNISMTVRALMGETGPRKVIGLA